VYVQGDNINMARWEEEGMLTLLLLPLGKGKEKGGGSERSSTVSGKKGSIIKEERGKRSKRFPFL